MPKIVVEPGFCAVKTPALFSAVITLAVPLQVAEPLLSEAVVGATVAPYPDAVTARWVPLAMVFVPVKATVAVAPTTPRPEPPTVIRVVTTVAVPLQVAVPLLNVAVVGAVVAPDPDAVTIKRVPLAMLFGPVKVTDAVAPVTPLKPDRLQVWPVEPVIVPPEV